MYDAVAFAGGGNRCYWQGGFWEAAAPALGLWPKLVVGVSAGAWAACYSLLGLGPRVHEMVAQGCSGGRRNFEWREWRAGRSPWPVGAMYRALIEEIVTADAFARLKAGPELLFAVARAPRRLPLALSVPLGIAIYQIEKKLAGPVHPRGGRALGFRSDHVRVQDLAGPDELLGALMASASVPPFMPVGRITGMAALDGGLVDNVPVEPLAPVEARGGSTLVLLSRRYRALPATRGRTYVQPSAPVAVGQFDITNADGIRAAYALGRRDGEAFVAARLATSAGAAAGAPS